VRPLFENAVDSLETGMQFFRDKKPKFAILLVFHSIELLLKELLSRQHPVLIYRKIDSNITEDSQTVGLAETLTRFKNVGISFSKDETETLKALQRRRNRIEHHQYAPDADDHDTLGQSLKFIMSFIATHLNDDLKQHIDEALVHEIEAIILSFDEQLAVANYEYEQWAEKTFNGGFESEDFQGTVDCPICGQTLLVLGEPSIGDYCFFCRTEVNAAECDCCGRTFIPPTPDHLTCDFCTAYTDDEDG